MREYNDYIRVMLKEGDREKIEKRMKEAGVKNMSAYIRKMAIDGIIVNLDITELNETTRLLRINANNLNQYAKRANETGSIYLEDIKELKEQLDGIWDTLKEIWKKISRI